MTTIKDQIRAFILKALRSADGEPMQESVLKDAIRQAFKNVAHTEADLVIHIQHCEQQGWIVGTFEELTGTSWALTTKGKLKASQLG